MQLQIKTKDYLKVKSQGQSVESNNVIENEIITETTLEPSETEVTISGNGEQENEANPGSSQGPSQQGQGQADVANLGSSQGPSPQGQGQKTVTVPAQKVLKLIHKFSMQHSKWRSQNCQGLVAMIESTLYFEKTLSMQSNIDTQSEMP